MALTKYTDSMRHERDMVRAVVGREGWKPGITFDEAERAEIEQPVLMVYGTADPLGSVDIWRGFVDQMPHGEFEIVDGGGHLVWYDDPSQIGGRIERFLRG
jgi:pimeloyl-ACP methyl ester carboxylesterase